VASWGLGPRSLGLHTTHTPLQGGTGRAPTLTLRQAGPSPHAPLGVALISTAPHTAVPAMASGTFNPLHKVLCILRSLYLCTIGPTVVLLLARDTPGTSNCSLKQLYSWMRPAEVQAAVAQQSGGRGQYPSVVVHSRAPSWCHGQPRQALPSHSTAHSIG